MNKGIIAIDKPQDWTSFDVVNKIKHLLKLSKVGHLGTLDPMATGLLLVTIGKATRLFDLMQEKTKTYIAKFVFGEETDTLDSTGKVVSKTCQIPTREEIERVIPKFIGTIQQLPPKFSAKSINGKRAYDLARANVDFELKPATVSIYSIDILDYTDSTLTLKIVCGSGTYIRAIGRDIASELNTLATMTELRRTDIDRFSVDRAEKIHDLTIDNIFEKIIPINEVLDYPVIILNKTETMKILNGQTLQTDLSDGLYKLNDEIDTIAIVKITQKLAKMTIFLA